MYRIILDKLTKRTGGKLFLPKDPIEQRAVVKDIVAATRGTCSDDD
jgi:hypothetical protein